MARKRKAERTPAQRIIDEIWLALRERGDASGRAPTEAVLADWIPVCPADAQAEASERLAASIADVADRYWRNVERLMSLPADDPEHRFEDVDGLPATPDYVREALPGESLRDAQARYVGRPADDLRTIHERAAASFAPEWSGLASTASGTRAIHAITPIGIRPLNRVHEIWRDLPDDAKPKHPLAPILRAWHRRAGALYTVKHAGSLVEWHRADPSDMRLMDTGEAPAMADLSENAQMVLPLFGDRRIQDDGTISWILALYALAGGPINGMKNLPPALIMAVGAMAHLHIKARDSEWHKLRFPTLIKHRENWPLDTPPPWLEGRPPPSMEEWLRPDGYAKPARDWLSIREGLNDMRKRLAYMPIPGWGNVAWLFPSVILASKDDPMTEITIQIPRSVAHGTHFDWPYFLSLASGGHARLARAYLSAVAYMGRTATNGMAQTAELPRAVLGPDGKPARNRQGKIRRDPALGFEPNPQEKFLKPLTARALARMEGFENPSKERLRDARRDFEKLAADGVFDFVKVGPNAFRIMGPSVRAMSLPKPGGPRAD